MAPAKSKGKSSSKRLQRQKSKKDPNAPKGIKSPYFYWLEENRDRLKVPGMHMSAIMKLAGSEWNKLGEESKQKYVKLCNEDRKRYEAEMTEYLRGEAAGVSKSPTKVGSSSKITAKAKSPSKSPAKAGSSSKTLAEAKPQSKSPTKPDSTSGTLAEAKSPSESQAKAESSSKSSTKK